VAEVRRATGLSAPTIIAAHKAYLQGGWAAVDTAKRGRPARGHEQLPSEAEAALHVAVLRGTPQDEQLPNHYVWNQESIAAWVQARYGHSILPRSAARLLHRWDLVAASMLDESRAATDVSTIQWLASDYRRHQVRARRAGGRILWIGQRTMAGGQHQLYAHTPRGQMYWLVMPRAPVVSQWQAFLQALIQQIPEKIFAVLANGYLARPEVLGAWLDTQSERFEAIYVPANAPPAPALRRATPESTPVSLESNTRPEMPLTHLQRLEAESIHIMREVVAEADNPVMLYSIGKDSAVMLHLAMKAFYPAIPPFPLLHVDTRWKFRDMYTFRDKMAKELGMKLLVHINPEGVAKDINPFTHGSAIHTDVMKTEGLKQALNQYKFDAAFGGARRDEEKSRAKERIFSFRTEQHRWDPKNQRPELWKLYNARKHKGESMRVFPLSNWTELDIWQYIYLENIPIVPLYYSATRPVVERDGTLIMVDDDRMPLNPGEVPMMKKVRFRTLGCYPLTGAVESEADTLPAIIQEMLLTRTSERQGRVIDHDSAASMEKKKQEGYF